MNKNNNDELEFSRVKKLVASYATLPEAKKMIESYQIRTSISAVEGLLTETEEMVSILNQRLHIPFVSSDSIMPLLKKVDKGLILNPDELEKIADFIRVNRLLQRFFAKQKSIVPTLFSYANELQLLDDLEDEIYRVVEHGQVSDYADRDLVKLRRQSANLDEKIKTALHHYLQSKQISKYLQNSLIIEKSGHYTLPIKASFKNQLSGNVIDESNNGSTVYIEPTKIANLVAQKNNVNVQIEAIELQILGVVTAKVYENLSAFKHNLSIITDLDVILAKAKYSYNVSGCRPNVNRQNHLSLNQMHHPLLDKPVPLSLKIENQRGLLITGPNAGGKTICIKTIALAILMTEMGLFLPAKKCNIPIMDNVFSLIGDHQDIDNSLSTFSAEMVQISEIVEKAQKYSLIVLDELGSGTDPNEGAAIAIAVLQELQMRGCIVVATTHYSSIKDFSIKNAGFMTASMDFDLENLEPTYHLVMNQAGESRALWIARKSGMPKKVLHSAQKILKTGKLPVSASKVVFKNKTEKQKNTIDFHKGDIVYCGDLKHEGIFYEKGNVANEVTVFIDKEFKKVPLNRIKLRRKASDLYPEGYNLDLLFVQNWQEFKLNKDLNRGSKKAWKKLKG